MEFVFSVPFLMKYLMQNILECKRWEEWKIYDIDGSHSELKLLH